MPESVSLAAKGGSSGTEAEVRCSFTLRPGDKAAAAEDAEEGGVGVGEVSRCLLMLPAEALCSQSAAY